MAFDTILVPGAIIIAFGQERSMSPGWAGTVRLNFSAPFGSIMGLNMKILFIRGPCRTSGWDSSFELSGMIHFI